MKDIKSIFKKVWWFIWEDDSILSWFVNLLLAFIIVKFILYPGLGLILGTPFPVVAVVSGSMEHDGNFDYFWSAQQDLYAQHGITNEQFQDFIFKNGFNKGDLMVLYRVNNVNIGDVIVFSGGSSEPIIHRVVKISGEGYYTTKGDHNLGSRNDELSISKDRLYGKAVLRLPWLGWFKIGFSSFLELFGVTIN